MTDKEFDACCDRIIEQQQNLILLAQSQEQCIQLQQSAIYLLANAIACESAIALGDVVTQIRLAAKVNQSNIGAGI